MCSLEKQLYYLEREIEECKQFIPLIMDNREDYEGFLYKLDELEDEYLRFCHENNIEPNMDIFLT